MLTTRQLDFTGNKFAEERYINENNPWVTNNDNKFEMPGDREDDQSQSAISNR